MKTSRKQHKEELPAKPQYNITDHSKSHLINNKGFFCMKKPLILIFKKMEQATGIEPASLAWEAKVLPLNYACVFHIVSYFLG